jgi:hypothetical protein
MALKARAVFRCMAEVLWNGDRMTQAKIETVVVESGENDFRAPLIILGVYQQLLSADIATSKLRESGNLSDEGPKILEMLMIVGRDPRCAQSSFNLTKATSDVCGFSEERAKAALTKAIKMGLLKGGPLLS